MSWHTLQIEGIAEIEREVAVFFVGPKHDDLPMGFRIKVHERQDGAFFAYPEIAIKDKSGQPDWICGAGSTIEQALAKGHTAPKWHALTRPARLEAEATHRAICLAEVADVPVYIVHLSAAEALEQVTLARDRGLPAFAETCPQYLFLSYDNYEEPGFEGAKYVMSPPLRAKDKQKELWRGLRSNDLQAVSTDHCPFCMKTEKQLGLNDFSKIPNGAPGIEQRMSLLYDGGVLAKNITLNRYVEITSTSPAKIFGLFPRKGTLAVGSDADVVVWDPKGSITWSAKTHHMNVDYNPYEGRTCQGAPALVMSRGEVIVDKGSCTAKPGRGKFLKRAVRS